MLCDRMGNVLTRWTALGLLTILAEVIIRDERKELSSVERQMSLVRVSRLVSSL